MSPKNNKGRAVVTYGRSLIALMIAQSLGSRGIDVIGCDSVDLTVLSFSKFVSKNKVYGDPHKDETRFLDDLEKIVRKYKPEDERPYVLIPAFSEAKIIARHKDRFEGLITLACPDFEAIDKIDPKDHFARTMQELDIESPRTWLPENEADIDKALDEIDFPVFIKPPAEVGGRGISKVKNGDELKKGVAALQKRYPGEQILIQSSAAGTDYCFCGLFDRGELVASMVYHNLRKFPKEAGPGVVRETVDSKKFDRIAGKLMKKLQWHGVAEIDFLWDEKEDSTPQMIEVNTRFWAGLDHSIKSGVDFPWLLYQLFTNGAVDEPVTAKVGHKTSLPGLAAMARIEELFTSAVGLKDLEERWPEIQKQLKAGNFKEAATSFRHATKNSFSFDEAAKTFKTMLDEAKKAERISYAKDDPFIGMGVLFILASLIRHGELPPEITR